MLDFITVPIVVGIVCLGVYSLFELFIRKKERLAIIEKIDGKLDASSFEGKIGLPAYASRFSFSALKTGALLMGIGLGLLVAFFIFINVDITQKDVSRYGWNLWNALYGACVLFFGGLGLMTAFIIEIKLSNKDK